MGHGSCPGSGGGKGGRGRLGVGKRVTDQPKEGFDFGGEYATRYDRVIRSVVPGYDDLLALVPAILSRRVRRSGQARILVVGAGSGNELDVYGRAEPGWTFVAVEPAREMLKQAEARVAGLGMAPRVEFFEGALADLPPTEPFDAATLSLVLHFQPDDGAKLGLLEDMAARLAAGSPAVVIDAHGEDGSAGFGEMMDAWMQYVLYRGTSPEDQARYRQQVRDGVFFVSEERMEALFREAGFTGATLFFRAFVFGGWVLEKGSL